MLELDSRRALAFFLCTFVFLLGQKAFAPGAIVRDAEQAVRFGEPRFEGFATDWTWAGVAALE